MQLAAEFPVLPNPLKAVFVADPTPPSLDMIQRAGFPISGTDALQVVDEKGDTWLCKPVTASLRAWPLDQDGFLCVALTGMQARFLDEPPTPEASSGLPHADWNACVRSIACRAPCSVRCRHPIAPSASPRRRP